MFEIIQALPDDAEIIAEIKIKSWRKSYKNILPDTYLDSLNKTKKAKKYRYELIYSLSTYSFLIKLNTQPIGMIKVEIVCDFAILRDIYFLPEYWNMGFGAKAYYFAISFVGEMNCKSITAWIVEGNARAQSAAARVGFAATDELSEHGATGAQLRKYIYNIDQYC